MPRPDPLPSLHALALSLGRAERSEAGFAALQAAVAATLGFRLCSVMLHDAEAGWNMRVHSSVPEHYPIGGRKPLAHSAWTRRLFRDGEPWLCRDAAEIRASFPDHVLIESLGCGGALNLPVRWRGRTLGTLNLLHAAGWYDAADLPTGQLLAALAVPLLEAKRRAMA